MHAGNSRGFVKGAELLFSSTTKSADYHDNMNAELFKKWFTELLLPNLDTPSLIIMDNASYHSKLTEKVPNLTWRKGELQEYLEKKKISYEPNMFKAELYALAKGHPSKKIYEIDVLANEWGHKVIRLPPYHCQFNPIELVWANCKEYYNKNIGRDGYGDEKVLSMWAESLEKVTAEEWAKCIGHSEAEIMQWWKLEQESERVQQPLIINLQHDTSDEDDESDSE